MTWLQEFAVVLGGVAAGAVLLPELTSDLWTMHRKEIRETVPPAKRDQLIRELIGAASHDDEWADYVADQGLFPMLRAGVEPLNVQQDLNYSVVIDLERIKRIDGVDTAVHEVHTVVDSKRLLPLKTRQVWVSIARTQPALLSEYGTGGCLLRELVELPSVPVEKWAPEVIRQCRIRIMVGDIDLVLTASPQARRDSTPQVVRWIGDLPKSLDLGKRLHVTIDSGFPLDGKESAFPMIFASYYAVGSISTLFRVSHQHKRVVLEQFNFCTRQSGGASASEDEITEADDTGSVATSARGATAAANRLSSPNDRSAEVRFNTRDGAVLWPGSGLLYRWTVDDELAR